MEIKKLRCTVSSPKLLEKGVVVGGVYDVHRIQDLGGIDKYFILLGGSVSVNYSDLKHTFSSGKFEAVKESEIKQQEKKEMYIIKEAPEEGQERLKGESNKFYTSETKALDAAEYLASSHNKEYIVFKAVKSVAPVRNVTIKDL